MGSEWQQAFLTDLYDIGSGLSKPAGDFGSGYPFLSFKDVFYNVFVPAELGQLVQSDEKEQQKCSVRRGDVFLTRTSETMNELGMSSVALKDYPQATFNGFTKRLRPKAGNSLVPEYVAYYLRSPVFRTKMLAFSTMSTRASLNNEMISRLTIDFPTPAIQSRIAGVLKAFDNKIVLNRQINTTLESMAQALFKSWFVDFDPVIDNALAAGSEIPDELQARADRRRALLSANTETAAARLPQDIQQLFPDRFVFTEDMGWVPEGWEVKTLSSMIELIGGGTPKTSVEEYWGGDIPWFSVVDAPNPSDVFVLSTEKSITQAGLDNSSAKLLPKGTTIISARGTVGKCAVVARPMAMNQSCYGLRGVGGNADYFTYYMVLRKVQELQQRSHGSVFSTITRDTFKGLNVAACSPLLTKKFDSLIGGHMDRILSNLEQVQVLSSLRDSLLPKLLSGQLSIPEAEQALDEVN